MRCTQTASSDDPLSADTPYVDETRAALIVKDLRRVIREAKVDLGSGTSLSLSPSVPVALINAATKLGDNNAVVYAMEKLVTYYPKKEYWVDLMSRMQRKPTFSDRLSLDAYRLSLATGSMTSE